MSDKKTSVLGGLGYKIRNLTDTNLLLAITIVVFFLMYIGAVVFQGGGFLAVSCYLHNFF